MCLRTVLPSQPSGLLITEISSNFLQCSGNRQSVHDVGSCYVGLAAEVGGWDGADLTLPTSRSTSMSG